MDMRSLCFMRRALTRLSQSTYPDKSLYRTIPESSFTKRGQDFLGPVTDTNALWPFMWQGDSSSACHNTSNNPQTRTGSQIFTFLYTNPITSKTSIKKYGNQTFDEPMEPTTCSTDRAPASTGTNCYSSTRLSNQTNYCKNVGTCYVPRTSAALHVSPSHFDANGIISIGGNYSCLLSPYCDGSGVLGNPAKRFHLKLAAVVCGVEDGVRTGFNEVAPLVECVAHIFAYKSVGL